MLAITDKAVNEIRKLSHIYLFFGLLKHLLYLTALRRFNSSRSITPRKLELSHVVLLLEIFESLALLRSIVSLGSADERGLRCPGHLLLDISLRLQTTNILRSIQVAIDELSSSFLLQGAHQDLLAVLRLVKHW